MTARDWYLQGDILGSTTTIQDWVNTMHDDNQQFENDGVQARINRSIATKHADKAVEGFQHSDPIVYSTFWHVAFDNAMWMLTHSKNIDWLA